MDRRYKKRMTFYWDRERKKSFEAIGALDFSTWFDLWHTHPDWKCKGNRYIEDRITVAKMTYDLLKYAEDLAGNREIQIFATICEDTGSNAVYFHTKNPNSTPFPFDFNSKVEWGVTTPSVLENIVDLVIHEIGKAKYDDEIEYIIRKKLS